MPSSSARPFRRLPRPVLRRPARGRPCPPAARCGPGGRDVREPRPPRGSQAVQTLTHSCLERRRGPPPPFLLRGGRAADGLREGWGWAAGRPPGPAPSPLLGCGDLGAAEHEQPAHGQSPAAASGGLRPGGVRDLISGAWAGRPLPQTPGARACLASGRRTPWARGWPRRPAGRAASGALAEGLAPAGVTQITLFNYTVLGQPSAIGAF